MTGPALAALLTVSAVLATGATALLAGCASDRPARFNPSHPSPPTTASPDPHAEAKAAALAAYRGMWDAFAKAGETADHKSPTVPRYATGNARTRIVAALLSYRDQGIVTQGRLTMAPRVTSLSPARKPSTATVVDCADSSQWTKHHRTSGTQINEPAGERKITATVVLAGGAGDGGTEKNGVGQGGVWKVSDFDAGDIGSCD